ncbi:hypothetical protein L3X38_025079 [Prunus dulcis]|uniref:Cyclic nucleotide-binding domain-containing protein n=1 Tax=Prunus dulcis TaxID=3755 RepID=A0AAD4W1T6_PRUDU|nr:hypothetical protein L3X38_025079 [Prunus dulcis]
MADGNGVTGDKLSDIMVKELQHMNDGELGRICDYLKPKVFEENAKVVEVGKPLNAMLYIIAGSMQAPITDAGEAAPSTSFILLKKVCLMENNFWIGQ